MSESMLAAVAAAAAGGAVPPAASQPAPVQTAAVQTAAPDLAAIRSEAAKAERERILAIDGLAVAGCEDVVARAKADGLAPGEAAIAILGKIKAGGLLDAVKAMSASAASVPPIAADIAGNGAPQPPAAAPEGPEKWKAEYAADPKISGEFISAEDYVAWKTRQARAA